MRSSGPGTLQTGRKNSLQGSVNQNLHFGFSARIFSKAFFEPSVVQLLLKVFMRRNFLNRHKTADRVQPHTVKGYETASFKFFPGLNFGTFAAGIFISTPVRGFRPVLGFLSVTVKVPNPVNITDFPDLSSSEATIQYTFQGFLGVSLCHFRLLGNPFNHFCFVHADLLFYKLIHFTVGNNYHSKEFFCIILFF